MVFLIKIQVDDDLLWFGQLSTDVQGLGNNDFTNNNAKKISGTRTLKFFFQYTADVNAALYSLSTTCNGGGSGSCACFAT